MQSRSFASQIVKENNCKNIKKDLDVIEFIKKCGISYKFYLQKLLLVITFLENKIYFSLRSLVTSLN